MIKNIILLFVLIFIYANFNKGVDTVQKRKYTKSNKGIE